MSYLARSRLFYKTHPGSLKTETVRWLIPTDEVHKMNAQWRGRLSPHTSSSFIIDAITQTVQRLATGCTTEESEFENLIFFMLPTQFLGPTQHSIQQVLRILSSG
jgi:hypothetical protein